MKHGYRVLDSDIHVVEPLDLWTRYLDPEFRDRAPTRREPGTTWLELDGRALPAGADTPARRRALEIRYRSPEVLAKFARRGEQELAELATGTTPASMLTAMDVEGVDVAVVFRTQGAHVIAFDDQDPRFSAALCRAFNRWLAEFCAADPARLHAGALVPLQDGALAVAEAEFAVETLGARTIVLPSHPVRARSLSDPAYESLWAAAEALDVAVSVHGIQASYTDGMLANRYPESPVLGHAAGHPVELMLSLGAVLTGGVAARHPGLRLGFLEGSCGWLPWWLWALDERWDKWGDPESTGQHERPSELFGRQCWVSTEVDEPMLGTVVDALGPDNLVISTDWPHDDSAYPDAIDTFLGHCSDDVVRTKVLWDNCARLYGLEAP